MNALAVLVLLLFFIVVALSLVAWAALSLGTKRRAALAAGGRELAADGRASAAGGRAQAEAAAGTRTARAEASNAARAPRVAVQPAGVTLVGRDEPAPAAAPRASGATREGRAGRPEPVPGRPRDVVEQPWLRSRQAAEGSAGPAPAEQAAAKDRRPRVVNTDAGADARNATVVPKASSRTPVRLTPEPSPAEQSAPEPQAPRATVTPRKVERDAFDRFLDAERRRD